MKTKLLALAMLLGSMSVVAQNPYIALEGATEGAEGVVVSLPRTILAVDVTVEHDVTLAGPYARYAQKFLGVRAPLTDKSVYAVKSARVSLLDDEEFLAAPQLPAAAQRSEQLYARAEGEFPRLQADKNSSTVRTLEEAAEEAASTIFSLRRHRLELITGEAGENVFGEGLNAALEEIARQEQLYLELFLGKHVVTTSTSRFVVYPDAGNRQYIVCRFSEGSGLLPENDLSGDIVLLQIEPTGASIAVPETSPKESNAVSCRVAAPATCAMICGGREYSRSVLPLFEFGRTVKIALPRRK